jgi:adenosine kinase
MSAVSEGCILGMGNPLLDISATVTTEYLAKYGLEANNQILAEESHMPIYPEIVKDFEVEYIAGGATQNSIRVAQWMLQTPATSYMGCVGNDEYGATLKKAASDSGVKVEYAVDEETPTGTCAVLITGNDRSLVANISAANNYKVAHLEGVGKPLMEAAKFYYISGFFITVSPESIMTVAKHAAAENKVFTMNLSAPFIMQVPPFKAALFEALPYCDILFGNETEYAEFAKAQEFGTEDLKEIALKTSMLPKANGTRGRLSVITQGSEPTIIAVNGAVAEYPIEAVAADAIVDTNGAGDAWVGGFLAALAHGKTIEECTKAASYAAKVVICRSGCTYPESPEYTF